MKLTSITAVRMGVAGTTQTDKPMKRRQGFTLPELLIASTVVLLTSVGILFTYVQCLELNRMNHDTSLVLQAVRNLMEEIRSVSPSMVHDTYNEKTHLIEEPKGIVLVTVNDQDPQLLLVTAKCFWKQGKGRMMGEDINFNGMLDLGEDVNKNDALDSPLTLVTYVHNR
jgi:prepilin-type N-terminal cleavage/methylation domain-containing protein